MDRLPVAFAAIVPGQQSVDACVFDTRDAAECRVERFEASMEGTEALAGWLLRGVPTQVAIVTGAKWPWQVPDGHKFTFTPGGPTLADWLRYRDQHDLGAVSADEIWQAIYLTLEPLAAVLMLTAAMIEELPLGKHKRRDVEWLAGMLRQGALRFAYGKTTLERLCDWLPTDDAERIEECVAFLELNTKNHRHGRARAKMARRLGHCPLTPGQIKRLAGAILERFENGDFSEQFKDQLKLIMHLDPKSTLAAARRSLTSSKDHVRRYAEWLLQREPDAGQASANSATSS